MKKIIFVFFVAMGMAGSVQAQQRTARGLTEAQQLGITAGLALACNAGAKLDDFELIASRLIANKAPTEAVEKAGYREFAESKLKAYQEQKEKPQIPCSAVLEEFNNLPVFLSTVYADGSLKMNDGKMLRPKRPARLPQKSAVKQASAKTAPKRK